MFKDRVEGKGRCRGGGGGKMDVKSDKTVSCIPYCSRREPFHINNIPVSSASQNIAVRIESDDNRRAFS